MQITDIKDDNSYSKGVNEEKKEETIMNFKMDKTKDKDDHIEYNNNELNNLDNHSKQQQKKIKLNSEVLKQTKLSTDKELIDNNKKQNDTDNKNEEKNQDTVSTFGGIGGGLLTKINRCFSDRTVLIFIIIMLLYSISLLIFSILDFIKRMKYKKAKNLFINELLFFILDIINISIILMFHIMNYYLKTRIVHNFVLVLVSILVVISVIRCFNYAKKNVNLFAIIINLCEKFFSNLINGLTLLYFFNDLKLRKNKMHGIEEIINFSELNVNAKKKDEDTDSNKQKPTAFVEEDDNNK